MNRSIIAANQSWQFFLLAPDATDMARFPGPSFDDVLHAAEVAGEQITQAGIHSSSQAVALLSSPSAFSFAPTNSSLCHSAAVSSPVLVPPPSRTLPDYPSNTSKNASAKRLCTDEELLWT